MALRNQIRFSDHWAARAARGVYYAPRVFSLPAPRVIFVPLLAIFIGLRSAWYFLRRVFFAEPLFKAYCTQYGKRLKTDIYLHWVQGKGEIILVDDVLMDGRIGITFAARYRERPRLVIGSNSGIGHGCSFRIGKEITIGKHVRMASNCVLFDAAGHSMNAAERRSGVPAHDDEVKPITIEDNVWIGMHSIIFPGATIGENSVVIAGSAVTVDVPANTVVGGNPARKIGNLMQRQQHVVA